LWYAKRGKISLYKGGVIMAGTYRGYTDAQNKATQKYHKENLEQIAIRVPKGKREEYKEHAKKRGESLAGLICRLLDEDIARG
jgi:hypothetical protein